LWHRCYNGAWRAWQSLGGIHHYDPDAVSWNANRIDVFSVNTKSQLTHIYANIPNNEVGDFKGNWEVL
jgi:peptide methionine sulfoxide reductase MsrB